MSEFRLHTVWRVRKQREDQAQQHLAQAQRLQQEICSQLEIEKDRLASLHTDMHHLQTKGVDPQTLQLFEHCIQSSRQYCLDLNQDLARAEVEIQERQEHLSAACREKKVVEKLHERHLERWAAEMRRAEKNLMDEIASGVVARKRVVTGEQQ